MTWQILTELGVGELQLHPTLFFDMTYDELLVMLEGSRRKSREQWEQVRWLAMQQLRAHLKKGAKLDPRKDFIEFPWEKNKPSAAVSIDEIKKGWEFARKKEKVIKTEKVW
jgi:hypothetical protein